MSYATVSDIQDRMLRELSADEETLCSTLLEDAAVTINAIAPNASEDAKRLVSCRMVIRVLGDGSEASGIPLGATQGSMSALGYTQSWTIGSGGGSGELYLSKSDKRLLGIGNSIGSYSPVEELVPEVV